MTIQHLIQLFACVCIAFAPAPTGLNASEPSENLFQLEYRDGTILTSSFTESELLWTDVSEFGQMTKRSIDVTKIASLTLTSEPACEQLAAILQLIRQLDSDDFFAREEAERQLRKDGKRFRSMIAKNNSLETPDGVYRLKRILSSMRVSPKSKPGITLDVLTLKDGRKLSGDAGLDDLQFTFDGKLLEVPRKSLAKISRANAPFSTRPQSREFVETKLFHDHAKFMKGSDLRLVDFEHKPDGTPLTNKDKDTSFDFVDFGLILGTEYPKGCVGISGFEVKGGDKPVGENSICVYKSRIKKSSRYQGVLEITFCQPGKQNIPYGVRNFGMFLSKVNHSRDILVEAYDSMDRLIGVCESNDEITAFFGISSTVPIARIRATSNPWILAARRLMLEEFIESEDPSMLERVEDPKFSNAYKKVDQDFAADSIMFSSPVPIDSVREVKHFYGRNGDIVDASWVRVFDADRIELGSRNIKLMNVSLSQANTVAIKVAPKVSAQELKKRGTWMAMLRDNSVLEWNPGSFLRSTTLGVDLSREDVIAVWPATKQPQLPLTGDFDSGTNVLVYPGCRIATSELTFNENGFGWGAENVLMEDLHEINDQKFDQRSIQFDTPDKVTPSKKQFSFDTNGMKSYETPTIWFERPTSLLADQGALRLESGEVLVYGANSLTEFKTMDRKQVTLTFRGNEVVVPLSKIVSFVPPQK